MGKSKVYLTRRVPQEAVDRLSERCEPEIWRGRTSPPREALLEAVRDVEGFYCLLSDRVDEDLVNAAPHLKVVSVMAAGYDNVDLEARTRRGIPVGHTPSVLTEATADLTWALLMAAARRLPEAERAVREGEWLTWEPLGVLGRDIYGATLGIIGMGRITIRCSRSTTASSRHTSAARASRRAPRWPC